MERRRGEILSCRFRPPLYVTVVSCQQMSPVAGLCNSQADSRLLGMRSHWAGELGPWKFGVPRHRFSRIWEMQAISEDENARHGCHRNTKWIAGITGMRF